MGRWLTIGGAVLVLFWAPFLYSELTSEPAEKKARTGVDEDFDDEDAVEATPIEDEVVEPEDEDEEEEAEEDPAPELEAPEEAPGEAPAEDPSELEAPVAEELPTGAAELEDTGEEVADEAAEDEPSPTAAAPMPGGPTAVLRSAFEVEHRDSFWAPGAESRIAAIFARVEAPAEALEAAECHKRVCRVEMAWEPTNPTVYTDVYGAIREEFGAEVAVEPLIGPQPAEGEETAPLQKVVLYLPRKGYSVADMVE